MVTTDVEKVIKEIKELEKQIKELKITLEDKPEVFKEDNKIMKTKTCIICGSTFTAHRSDARFCSTPCRQTEYRKRKSENKKNKEV
jgi:hypothetical protein